MKRYRKTVRPSCRRRRRSGSKAIAQKRHAKRRFCQRAGIHLSDEEYQDLIHQIQTGKADFLERQSNRVSLFQITIQDQPIVAVYDKNTSKIMTFLTMEMFKERYGNIASSEEDNKLEETE